MRKGFTLLEIILTLSIFAGILVMLMGILYQITSSFVTFERKMPQNFSALRDLARLRFFMTNALNVLESPVLRSSTNLAGKYELPTGRVEAELSLSSDTASFSIVDPLYVELASETFRDLEILGFSTDSNFIILNLRLGDVEKQLYFFRGD